MTTDALDAMQDALIAIVRGLDRFDGRSKFSTWVYRIATNCLPRRAAATATTPDPGPPGRGAGRAVSAGRIDDQVAARVDVDTALQSIALEFRVAVVLRDLCSLDYAEIADVLDIPPGTVRSRIARGRAALADQLGGNHPPIARRQNPRP